MNADPRKHHRQTIRLQGYDYTQPGIYFVTIVTYQRQELFGRVAEGQMCFTPLGEIARNQWLITARNQPHLDLRPDEMIVMPNHIHGLVRIIEARPLDRGATFPTGDGLNVTPGSLGAMVRTYKAATTQRINALSGAPGAPVWQRNYYEHILREGELEGIYRYIGENPARWPDDQLHPHDPPCRAPM